MEVTHLQFPLVAAASPLADDDDVEENENGDPVTRCGRCRLNFVRHPSITPGDSARWWLCPPCRTRLLGDDTKTSSRWSS